ncbi:MAG: TaqI-like C-terminal specificity domain-containing protein, partial [Candidatus Thorarchaeota archaeon]
YNIHALFIEASMNQLKPDGVLGCLVYKNLLSLDSYAQLRRHLLERHTLKHISDCGAGVFSGVTAETGIIVIRKGSRIGSSSVALSAYRTASADCVSGLNVPQEQYTHLVSPWNHRFITGISEGDVELFEVLRAFPGLATLASVSRGIETGCNSRFVSVRPEAKGNWQPLIRGRDITPYGAEPHVFIDYRHDLLSKPGRDGLINLPKVLVQQNARNPVAYYDSGHYFVLNSATYIADAPEEVLKSICTLINSRLVAWFFRTVVTNNARLTVNLLPCNLGVIPVPPTFDENLLGTLCDVLTMLRLSVKSSDHFREAFSLWHNVIAEATILETYFPHQTGTHRTTESLRTLFQDSPIDSDFAHIRRDSRLVRTALDTVDSIGVSRLLDSRP